MIILADFADRIVINKKAILINTVTQTAVRVVMLFVTLLSVKLLTNYLGVAGVGDYNTITTYLNFFLMIAELGLFSVTVREISRTPEKEGSILSNVLGVRIAISLLVTILSVILVFCTHYSTNIKYGVLAASGFLFLNLIASVYDMALQHRLKMQFSALAELISKLISVIALIVIITYRGNFLWVAGTIALSGLLILFFKWLFTIRFVRFRPSYNREIGRWLIRMAWPLGLVMIVNNLFFKLDTLMLFVIHGSVAVGIYSVAFKVLEVTVFIGSYFASALKPGLSQSTSNRQAISNIVNRGWEIMLIVALPIAAGSAIFAREIVIFLSNIDFVSGAFSLAILSLSLPIMYINSVLIEVLIARDERKTLIIISVGMLIFNFIANLILIPIYSYNGAAVVNFATQLLLMIVNIIVIKKYVSFIFNTTVVIRAVAATLIAGIGAWLLSTWGLNFIICLIALVLIYGAMIMIFKVLSVQSLKQILSRS